MIVVYEVQQEVPSLGLVAGQRVEVDPEVDTWVEDLVSAGLLAPAEASSEAPEDAPAEEPVEAALRSLRAKVEQLEKSKPAPTRKFPNLSVPAQPKEPVKKSITDMMRTFWRAEVFKDIKAINKFNAVYKAPSGINETTASEGGNTVNPEFSDEIWRQVVEMVNLQDYCTIKEASSKTLTVREINQSSLANGSIYGGLSIATASEGDTFNGSKPAWQTFDISLQKYYGFVYYTNEVLSDTSYSLESEVQDMVRTSFVNKLNTDLVSGASNPEGILNGPALKTVTTTSAHRTIAYADVVNMWAALYPESQQRAIWFVNPQVYTQLQTMTYTAGGTTPAWGITYDPRDQIPMKIFGRPVVTLWQAPALGAAGDIMLLDLKDYFIFRKPFEIAFSKDYAFNSDQVVFRFTLRLGGKNRWRSTLTGPTGADTYSNTVVLASRGTT